MAQLRPCAALCATRTYWRHSLRGIRQVSRVPSLKEEGANWRYPTYDLSNSPPSVCGMSLSLHSHVNHSASPPPFFLLYLVLYIGRGNSTWRGTASISNTVRFLGFLSIRSILSILSILSFLSFISILSFISFLSLLSFPPRSPPSLARYAFIDFNFD